MKNLLLTAAILASAVPAWALDGQPNIHDPSTVIQCDGKYYVFGTGGGGFMSDDGWTWRGGAVRPGGGVAPDVIHIGDRYIVAYGGGGGIHTMWTKTLDPSSTDCNFQDDTLVATSDLDCNPIDPALLLDPTDGKLWMTYGSYVGYIRLMELDPKTGKRVDPNVHASQHRRQLRGLGNDLPRRVVNSSGQPRQLLPRLRLRIPHIVGRSRKA